jgi:hypothetical protein
MRKIKDSLIGIGIFLIPIFIITLLLNIEEKKVHSQKFSTNEIILEKAGTYDDIHVSILKDYDKGKEYLIVQDKNGIAITLR